MRAIFLVLAIFLVGCGESVEESSYQGNYPQGTIIAMIGDKVIFTNGPEVLGVDENQGLGVMKDQCVKLDEFYCPYELSVMISDNAAYKQASATNKLSVIEQDGLRYLSEPLVILLEREQIGEMRISEDLKGKIISEIKIIGGAKGSTKEEAIANAQEKFDIIYKVLEDKQ